MEDEFKPQYEVRYHRAELQKMQWSGLAFGPVFALGPYILFKTGGQASSINSTIALWIWGILGLPLGVFLLSYSWWAFKRLRQGGLALVLNEEELIVCPMFLPEISLTYDMLQGTSFYEHPTKNGVAKSICLHVNDQSEVIQRVPIWARWWAKSTAASIGTPISLPERLVDCPLSEIGEGIEHFIAVYEAQDVIAKLKEDEKQVNDWYQSFKTDEEFAAFFAGGPVGRWVSAQIGFSYAPMDRDIHFGSDGKGWVSVAFVGPELEFEWRSIDNGQIEVWAVGEEEMKQRLQLHFRGREMMLLREDEDETINIQSETNMVTLELEFESLSYVRSTSSQSSS